MEEVVAKIKAIEILLAYESYLSKPKSSNDSILTALEFASRKTSDNNVLESIEVFQSFSVEKLQDHLAKLQDQLSEKEKQLTIEKEKEKLMLSSSLGEWCQGILACTFKGLYFLFHS